MKNLLLLIALIIIGTNSVVLGQFSNFEVLLQPGAAPGGLGDSYTALATDPYATYYNPAGVAHSKYKHQFLINTQKFTRLDFNEPLGLKQDQTIFIGRLWKITNDLGVAVTFSTFGYDGDNNAPSYNSNSLNFALGMRFNKKLSVGLGATRFNSKHLGVGIEQSSTAYSLGLMLQNLNIHPVVGNDTSGVSFGISFSGISGGVSTRSLIFRTGGMTSLSNDPYPATARAGVSTIVLNTDQVIIRTTFDTRKVFFKVSDDAFDKWFTPFFTGWDADDATFHMGAEVILPDRNIAFRVGRSREDQGNPKVNRLNYGIRTWYGSLEFVWTLGFSKNYVLDYEGGFESRRPIFELRYGIR